jgi:hypothetical protein
VKVSENGTKMKKQEKRFQEEGDGTKVRVRGAREEPELTSITSLFLSNMP